LNKENCLGGEHRGAVRMIVSFFQRIAKRAEKYEKNETGIKDKKSSCKGRVRKVGMNFLNGFLPHIFGDERNIIIFCSLKRIAS
jgi:hypothetical protein